MTYTLPDNITSITDLFIWGQEVTQYSFLPLFLIVFAFVIFLIFKGTGFSVGRSLAPAAFVFAIGATLFNILAMVSSTIVLAAWIILAISVLYLRIEG